MVTREHTSWVFKNFWWTLSLEDTELESHVSSPFLQGFATMVSSCVMFIQSSHCFWLWFQFLLDEWKQTPIYSPAPVCIAKNLGNAAFFSIFFGSPPSGFIAFALLILLLFRLVPISPFPISTSLTHYLWMYRVRIAISSFALVEFYETIEVQTLKFNAHVNIEEIDELWQVHLSPFIHLRHNRALENINVRKPLVEPGTSITSPWA